MLEIGMWRSAWKWWKDEYQPASFRDALIRICREKMAHFMGIEYRDAVLKCLSGELENRDDSVLKAFWIEVVEVLGRSLLDI